MLKIIPVNQNDEIEYIKKLKARAGDVNTEVAKTVSAILEDVKKNGDEAVNRYSLEFDGILPQQIEVSRDEINEALTRADDTYIKALLNAQENIVAFHNRQKQQSFVDLQENGSIMGQRVRGLNRVGIYVPGGTAAYPSSVLMNTVPARIAGVKEIIMVTPPLKNGHANPDILVAAAISGVDRIFSTGGAQAVAALAYGTESIPKVDKIVGPGNIFVATAKKLLFGEVDIDMIAGPSEILILADETAIPEYVAADLMSQAEHDKLASAILVTTSQTLAKKVDEALMKQIKTLSRSEIIQSSLENYSAAFVCQNIEQAIDLCNDFAPEHLEVLLDNPMQYLGSLDNAGSIFLGNFSPEPLGDYYAGPNHVLPTGGTARFFSPLSVDAFVKRTSFIYYTENALFDAKDDILTLAECEKLTAHANAIKVRFDF